MQSVEYIGHARAEELAATVPYISWLRVPGFL